MAHAFRGWTFSAVVFVLLLGDLSKTLAISPSKGQKVGHDGYERAASLLSAQSAAKDPIPVIVHTKKPYEGYQKGSPLYEYQQKRLMEDEPEAHGPRRTLGFAQCLFGAVIFIMALFYLVNHRSKDVSYFTWQTVSITIAIFCAVVTYSVVRDITHSVVGARTIGEKAFWNLELFLTLYILLQVSLYFLKRVSGGRYLLPVGTIFAHITAFAAMHGFAQIQMMAPYNSSPLWALVVVGMNAVVQIVLTEVSAWVRVRVALMGDRVIDEDEAHWIEEVKESESDFFSLSVGFLLMQVLRYQISGELQPYEPLEAPHGITWGMTFSLLACAILLGLAMPLTMFAMARNNRWAKLVHQTITMTFAMCVLYWADWQVYMMGFQGVRIAGCMLTALLLTVLTIFNIFVIDAIHKYIVDHHVNNMDGKKVMESMVLAFGVLVGLGWEKAFDIGMEALHEDWKQYLSDSLSHVLSYVLSTILILSIVVPAWMFHMLPRAHQHVETSKNQLRPGISKRPPNTTDSMRPQVFR